jgi:hypothetical protein
LKVSWFHKIMSVKAYHEDIVTCVQKNLLAKRNAKLIRSIPCFDKPNGTFMEFHQGDRFQCLSSTGRYTPADPGPNKTLSTNGLVYITCTSPFGKPLMEKFQKFMEAQGYSKYIEIIVVSKTVPTKQVRCDFEEMSATKKINVDIFQHSEIQIDRTVNVSVPRYQLLSKEKALRDLIVSKNAKDLENLPCIQRNEDVVARILFRVGDYVLVDNTYGKLLKRIT